MLTTHFSAKKREEGLGPGAQVRAGGSWAQPLVREAQSSSACLDGVSTRPNRRPGLGAGPSVWYLGICSPVRCPKHLPCAARMLGMGHSRETQPHGACWLLGGPALGRYALEEVQSLTASRPSVLCPLKDGTKPGGALHPERGHRAADKGSHSAWARGGQSPALSPPLAQEAATVDLGQMRAWITSGCSCPGHGLPASCRPVGRLAVAAEGE